MHFYCIDLQLTNQLMSQHVKKILLISFYLVFPCIQDSIGRFYCVSLRRANEIIGTTTEELVLKAKLGSGN